MSDPRYNLRQHTFQVSCPCLLPMCQRWESRVPVLTSFSFETRLFMTQGHCTCPLMSIILSALRTP